MKSLSLAPSLAALLATLSACNPSAEAPATSSSALTAEQCMYFEDGGKVTICHANGSASHPFTQIRIATAACVNAHADHPGDFVAPEGDCGADACLAEESPCDATLPCCDGLTCTDGRCAPAPLTCVSENFDAFGCNFGLPPQFPVFSNLATVSRLTGGTPLQTYLSQNEECELSLGACSTYQTDATHPILTQLDLHSSFAIDFAATMESFSLGKLYGGGLITVTFYRGGSVVLSETIDRSASDCTIGASRAWTPSGGFDRVVFSGNVIGISELGACHRG